MGHGAAQNRRGPLREQPCPERAEFFALPNPVTVLDQVTLRFWLALLQYQVNQRSTHNPGNPFKTVARGIDDEIIM